MRTKQIIYITGASGMSFALNMFVITYHSSAVALELMNLLGLSLLVEQFSVKYSQTRSRLSNEIFVSVSTLVLSLMISGIITFFLINVHAATMILIVLLSFYVSSLRAFVDSQSRQVSVDRSRLLANTAAFSSFLIVQDPQVAIVCKLTVLILSLSFTVGQPKYEVSIFGDEAYIDYVPGGISQLFPIVMRTFVEAFYSNELRFFLLLQLVVGFCQQIIGRVQFSKLLNFQEYTFSTMKNRKVLLGQIIIMMGISFLGFVPIHDYLALACAPMLALCTVPALKYNANVYVSSSTDAIYASLITSLLLSILLLIFKLLGQVNLMILVIGYTICSQIILIILVLKKHAR